MAYMKPYLDSFIEVTDKAEKNNVIEEFDLVVLKNESPFEYNLYKREFNIFPHIISVAYNIRIETKDLNIDDRIKINCSKALKFDSYDSDENTEMIESHKDNDYYAMVVYDSEYNRGDFYGGVEYSYAIWGSNSKGYEYCIVRNPKEHLEFDLEHIINVWIIHIDKTKLKDFSDNEISESVDRYLL